MTHVSLKTLTQWNQQLAALIRQPDQADFAENSLKLVQGISGAEMAMMVVHRPAQPPLHLCDSFQGSAAKGALQLYVAGTYVINAVYQSFLRGLGSGVYRITELAPDDYGAFDAKAGLNVHHHEHGEELRYRTFGWPRGMSEVTVALRLSKTAMIEICLLRKSARGGFGDTALDALRSNLSILEAAYAQHWAQSQHPAQEAGAHSLDHHLENFGKDSLTRREHEVVQMVLRGHSSLSISLNLGISVTTVKSHRKAIFAKLGIASQQELFSAFIQTLPVLQ